MTEVAEASSLAAAGPRAAPLAHRAPGHVPRPGVRGRARRRARRARLAARRPARARSRCSTRSQVESNRLYTPYSTCGPPAIEDAAPYTAVAATAAGDRRAAGRRRRPARDPRGGRRGRRARRRGPGRGRPRAAARRARAHGRGVRPLAARRRLDPARRREARAAVARRLVAGDRRPRPRQRPRRAADRRCAGPSGAARTLVGRTFIVLDDGAQASVVEELVAVRRGRPGRVQALLSATTEIRLGANARLAMASLQELGPDHVVFQQRLAHIGEGADLRWALAQLGGPPRPLAGRQRPGRRPEHGRAGRDRVRHRETSSTT